jgi:hypothetical protein
VLLDAAYDVIEVNRPDRSARRRQGKDDPEDAETAARAFLTGTASIVPKRGGDQVEMIRLLKVAKDSDIDGRTRALNQVRSLLVTAPMALRERLSGLSRNELITTCASFRPGELVGPQAAAKHALRSLARRIQALDAELKKLMADLDGLTQAACPGLRQSYGIGIDGGLSNKDILRCLKRFIAREVFHLLMGKPPRRTAAKNFARGLTIYGRICDSAPSLLSCSTTEHIGSSGLSRPQIQTQITSDVGFSSPGTSSFKKRWSSSATRAACIVCSPSSCCHSSRPTQARADMPRSCYRAHRKHPRTRLRPCRRDGCGPTRAAPAPSRSQPSSRDTTRPGHGP